jgi:hypothetical protein
MPPSWGGLLVSSRGEDLAAVALESQEIALRCPLRALPTHKPHGERAGWAWERTHLPLLTFLVAFSHAELPVEAGARWRLSVTDNSQGPGGDMRSMLLYCREHNLPVTQIEPLLQLSRKYPSRPFSTDAVNRGLAVVDLSR